MSLRTEYVRNFYADHQANFGQPDGTPTAVVRAAALREFDEWLREVKAEAWDEGYEECEGDVSICTNWNTETPNPYRTQETA